MKRTIVLIGCVFLLFGGCQKVRRNNVSEFPQSLAGAWEANKDNLNYWRIVFKPDGTISSAVIALGEYEVKPNQTTKTKGPDGEPGFIDAGDFDAFYNPKSRELTADIKLKQLYLDLGVSHGVIKGSWEFFITGEVSEDGKTWAGDWFNSTDIAALLHDPNSPKDKSKLKEAAKLQVDLGQEDEGLHLIFTKVVPDANTGSNK